MWTLKPLNNASDSFLHEKEWRSLGQALLLVPSAPVDLFHLENDLRKELPKVAGSQLHELTSGILCVISGARTSVLVDQRFPKMGHEGYRRLICNLRLSIDVIDVVGDIFLVNAAKLRWRLRVPRFCVTFVDVAGTPRVMEEFDVLLNEITFAVKKKDFSMVSLVALAGWLLEFPIVFFVPKGATSHGLGNGEELVVHTMSLNDSKVYSFRFSEAGVLKAKKEIKANILSAKLQFKSRLSEFRIHEQIENTFPKAVTL